MAADVAAIVPAAGASTRFGGRSGKLFARLCGQPLLIHPPQVLQQSPSIRWMQVVGREGEIQIIQQLLRRQRITKALVPCLGGTTRAESVARGFAALPAKAHWVLVQDAARPCTSRRLIEAAIRSAKRHGAVACGLPASLTIKAVDRGGAVRLTLDREQLWLMQTPQVFRRDWFQEALSRVNGHLAQFPDDVSILESAGFSVRVIPGDPLNLKVTTKGDLLLADTILRYRLKRRSVAH